MANGIVIEDKKLVYWFVPKAACTSVKKLIAQHMGMRIPKPHGKIHGLPFRKVTVKQARTMNGYTHFTVVRHPMPRLLSLFNNKIFRDQRNTKRIKNGVTAPIFAPYGNKFRANMTFEEFVQAIISVLDNPNIHFKRQSDIVPATFNMLVFKVGQIDELGEFLNRKGIQQQIPHENKTNTDSWKEKYTSELAAAVEQAYKIDFERFDYKNPFK